MYRFYSYYRSTTLPASFHSYLMWQIIIGCLSLSNGPTTHSFPYHQSCDTKDYYSRLSLGLNKVVVEVGGWSLGIHGNQFIDWLYMMIDRCHNNNSLFLYLLIIINKNCNKKYYMHNHFFNNNKFLLVLT